MLKHHELIPKTANAYLQGPLCFVKELVTRDFNRTENGMLAPAQESREKYDTFYGVLHVEIASVGSEKHGKRDLWGNKTGGSGNFWYTLKWKGENRQ